MNVPVSKKKIIIIIIKKKKKTSVFFNSVFYDGRDKQPNKLDITHIHHEDGRKGLTWQKNCPCYA